MGEKSEASFLNLTENWGEEGKITVGGRGKKNSWGKIMFKGKMITIRIERGLCLNDFLNHAAEEGIIRKE